MVAPGLRRAVGTLTRALLALLLAGAWLLSSGPPARAVDRWQVVEPASGRIVEHPTTIVASAEANPLQEVEGVQVRLVHGGSQVGAVREMAHASGLRSGGESRWTAPLDPHESWTDDGQALANGTYTLQVRVSWRSPRGAEETGWSGHDIVIDADPPTTTVSTRLIDTGARSVEVSWTPVPLPDFRRYVVERATDGGAFTEVAALATSSTTTYVDAAPEPATYRYRVVVVRAGAYGGERTSTSEERTIQVGEPGQPDPTAPITEPTEEPEPEPQPDESPGPDADQPDGDGEGSGEGPTDGSGDERQGGDAGLAPGSSGRRPSAGASVPRMQAADQAPRAATAPPSAAAPGDDTFVETLPYPDAPEAEEPSSPPRGEPLDGGTLAIHDRELVVEQVLPPLAGGMLLFVVAGHVLRLRAVER